MKLISFLKTIAPEQRTAFAASCETTWGYLKQVAYGNKNCGPALAINLERESARKVVCEELCPEADWAYIRAAGLPAEPQPEPEQAAA
jgi:DNA-binding transcriptional regulator YdaS (Cro superfamily)